VIVTIPQHAKNPSIAREGQNVHVCRVRATHLWVGRLHWKRSVCLDVWTSGIRRDGVRDVHVPTPVAKTAVVCHLDGCE
jgi:hypothetical protein